jgi:hypothetical protein
MEDVTFIGLPGDVSQVDIVDTNPLLLDGQPDLLGTKRCRVSGKGTSAPAKKVAKTRSRDTIPIVVMRRVTLDTPNG